MNIEKTKNQDKSELEYRRQLKEITDAFTTANYEMLDGYVPKGVKKEVVEMFVEGNFEKREDKLSKQLELVAEGFDDLPKLLKQFGEERQALAESSVMTDAEKFLDWLDETQTNITAQQQDRINVQRARHLIEATARIDRLDHINFQAMLAENENYIDLFEHNQDVLINLNPMRAWATLTTSELLEEDDEPPCTVLMYAQGPDTHTATFEEAGREFIELLADLGSCTFEELKFNMLDLATEDLVEFCQDLAEMGVIAFGKNNEEE